MAKVVVARRLLYRVLLPCESLLNITTPLSSSLPHYVPLMSARSCVGFTPPPSNAWLLRHHESTSQKHLCLLSCFCNAHVCDQQRHSRQTDTQITLLWL